LRHLAGRGDVRHDRRVRRHDRARRGRRDRQRRRLAPGTLAPPLEELDMARLCLSFVSLLSLALCWACVRPAGDAAHVRLAVGGQNQMVYLPTTLAQELGFYKEEGLDVELQDHAGGSKALQALIGGSADVVSGFYDHTIQMAAEGRSLVAFVNMIRFPGLVLVTAPQSQVTRIEDLKGRAAGVKEAVDADAYPASVLYAQHEWLRSHAETTRRLASAIVRTLQWMHTHTPREIADRTPKSFRGEDEALYVEAVKSSMAMFSP